VSPYGMAILEETGRRYRSEGLPGVFSGDDDGIITIVPTCIAEKPEKTCGLGDILSSTAFVADRF
jgi:ADP-dependent phosphofructokinase/glucokinase